jgi:hypothetical protein
MGFASLYPSYELFPDYASIHPGYGVTPHAPDA